VYTFRPMVFCSSGIKVLQGHIMPKEKVCINKPQLENLYLVQKRSLYDIGVIFGCNKRTVWRKIQRYGIPQRPRLTGKGRRISAEGRLRISLACRRGPAHHFWRGGVNCSELKKIRYSVEYGIWRDSVLARDNWTCLCCGKRGGDMEAHHIKQFARYPELRFVLDNGQTLCKKCHCKVTAEQRRQNSP